ncbi:putative calcium-binding protein CML10 [Drosera capensis]
MATTKSPPQPSTTASPPPRRLPLDDIRKIFSTFDVNSDGKISSLELQSILESLGTATTDSELALMMTEMDSNSDGFVEFPEFAEFYNRTDGKGFGGVEDEVRELKEAFDVYDKDKNGKISPKELLAVLKGLGEKCDLKDCKRMIGEVDVDGDGQVNFEEFKKMMA